MMEMHDRKYVRSESVNIKTWSKIPMHPCNNNGTAYSQSQPFLSIDKKRYKKRKFVILILEVKCKFCNRNRNICYDCVSIYLFEFLNSNSNSSA